MPDTEIEYTLHNEAFIYFPVPIYREVVTAPLNMCRWLDFFVLPIFSSACHFHTDIHVCGS